MHPGRPLLIFIRKWLKGELFQALLFRRRVTLDPLHRLIHQFRLPMLVGFGHELGNAFCMLKRTICREKRIVPEPVPLRQPVVLSYALCALGRGLSPFK
jgi:hypothetical protein